MSLSIAYESVQDAQMRLQGTIVLYDGKPHYIEKVSNVGPDDPKPDIFRVYCSPLPYKPQRVDPHEPFGRAEGAAKLRKFISSKKFDLAPFPMGFMNFNGGVNYLHRLPRKQQKQGLSAQTLGVDPLTMGMRPVDFNTLTTAKEFVECFEGRYPRFEEALRMLEGDTLGVAFARTFAVCKDPAFDELVYLYHKKEKVGFIMDGRLKLAKAAKCLKESLQEAGVQC